MISIRKYKRRFGELFILGLEVSVVFSELGVVEVLLLEIILSEKGVVFETAVIVVEYGAIIEFCDVNYVDIIVWVDIISTDSASFSFFS